MQKIYKSEIIAEILDKQGHSVPDIHYESECVVKWINDVKGSYPKLNDYESEWLDYFNEHGTGEFPYETFTGTSGTIDNVVPYAYKSAILSGNTLVNLFNKSQDSTIEPAENIVFKSDLYKTSTTYLIKFDVVSSNTNNKLMVQYYLNGQWLANYEVNIKLGINKFVITSITNQFDTIRLYYNSSYGSETVELKDIMLIEYQQGMENWDIPYFEGMKSVQMPDLKTTGKNLFDGKWIKGKMITEDGSIISDNGSQYSESFIRVSKGKYISSNNGTNRNVNIFKYDFDGNFIGRLGIAGSTFTVDGDCLIRFSLGLNNTDYFQFEQGTVATTYEPYKSNVLTTSEDVILRGIGEVKDELDCLTGEVTERIGEIVLDGSDGIVYQHQTTNQNTLRFFIKCFGYDANINTVVPFLTYSNIPKKHSHDGDEESIFSSWGGLYIRIAKEKLTENSVKGFKLWLSQNPITLQYQLPTESIKTVDLTIKDQDSHPVKLKPIEGTMHIQTSGNPINPVLNCEVPVEAITQNLASFTKE